MSSSSVPRTVYRIHSDHSDVFIAQYYPQKCVSSLHEKDGSSPYIPLNSDVMYVDKDGMSTGVCYTTDLKCVKAPQDQSVVETDDSTKEAPSSKRRRLAEGESSAASQAVTFAPSERAIKFALFSKFPNRLVRYGKVKVQDPLFLLTVDNTLPSSTAPLTIAEDINEHQGQPRKYLIIKKSITSSATSGTKNVTSIFTVFTFEHLESPDQRARLPKLLSDAGLPTPAGTDKKSVADWWRGLETEKVSVTLMEGAVGVQE